MDGRFTWSNLKEREDCHRLDRFLFSKGWLDLLLNARKPWDLELPLIIRLFFCIWDTLSGALVFFMQSPSSDA